MFFSSQPPSSLTHNKAARRNRVYAFAGSCHFDSPRTNYFAGNARLNPLLKICSADQFIKAATSSDDAEKSKPDPDILQAALKELGMSADEVLMLGDTPYDVEAARKAGMAAIALRCGGWDDARLKADAVYDDPADLSAHLEGSPLGGVSPGNRET
ncbi:HAD family hydrolase [Zavarzinella formosa]|uniref:HAD family hydrolase n=1 Tax=Zavarzinella formosa TaxID=360055 RepID=UPI0006983625|nr:HAD-IA family hydrolase [Zavarzinella formosa]